MRKRIFNLSSLKVLFFVIAIAVSLTFVTPVTHSANQRTGCIASCDTSAQPLASFLQEDEEENDDRDPIPAGYLELSPIQLVSLYIAVILPALWIFATNRKLILSTRLSF